MSESPPGYNTSSAALTCPSPPPAPPAVDRQHLQMILDDAAAFITVLHPSEQTGWLIYLLEVVDAYYSRSPFMHFEPVLLALKKAITLRQQSPLW